MSVRKCRSTGRKRRKKRRKTRAILKNKNKKCSIGLANLFLFNKKIFFPVRLFNYRITITKNIFFDK